MVQTERYGVPPTKIIELMAAWSYPFRNVQKGDKMVIFTDDGMDPLVWQSAMAAIHERGGDVLLCMYPKRAYHCADPSDMAVLAGKGADVVVALTTTALNSGTPGLRPLRAEGGGSGNTPIWLMEESTVEILTEGGGRAPAQDIEEICELQRRIGEVYDKGKQMRIISKSGTDLVADISGMEPDHFAKRYSEIPFSRRKNGKLGGGTWPYGEVHVEPVPNSANGTVVWDTTAHFPPGNWKEPVQLTIKNGNITAIDGGHEAELVRWYLDKYGDENTKRVGGEMAVGTNRFCLPGSGCMRSEKKRYGAMHYGIGHGADRGQVNSTLRLEGIIDRITIVVDDKVVCEDGKILV
jgi:hypothetical protein